MDNIIAFKSSTQQSVDSVLESAKGRNLDTICIVGIGKDGTHLFKSEDVSAIQLLGMIEAMKMHVYEHWQDV